MAETVVAPASMASRKLNQILGLAVSFEVVLVGLNHLLKDETHTNFEL